MIDFSFFCPLGKFIDDVMWFLSQSDQLENYLYIETFNEKKNR